MRLNAISRHARLPIMQDKISIKIALPEDVPYVAEIGKITFYETWRKVNTEEDMELYLKESFGWEKIRKDVSDAFTNIFLLAYESEKLIGYAKMRRDRTYSEFQGEKAIEIERIYVKREFQGKKVGKLLMDRCIEIAKSENSVWLWLGVNNENIKATRFYFRYGFEVFGTKKFKLGNAEDEDLLMKLRVG